jgi:hypothetical protein
VKNKEDRLLWAVGSTQTDSIQTDLLRFINVGSTIHKKCTHRRILCVDFVKKRGRVHLQYHRKANELGWGQDRSDLQTVQSGFAQFTGWCLCMRKCFIQPYFDRALEILNTAKVGRCFLVLV